MSKQINPLFSNAYQNDRRPDHCVVYRTGGTDNFAWHRTSAMTEKEANACRPEVERMGYKAMVVRYSTSLSIGLPETYE